MMIRFTTLALTATLLAAATAPALAQEAMRPTAATIANDRTFITGLLQESRAQLALAHLAQRRAISPEAATTAADAIEEWSALRSRLITIAYADGAPVRGTLDAAEHTMLGQLGRTQPARFDRVYLRDAERGDERALTAMTEELNSPDARIQRFIAYAQPIVAGDAAAAVAFCSPHDQSAASATRSRPSFLAS